MAIETGKRDYEKSERNLTEWIRTKLPDARDLRLSNLRQPGASGFSNETLLCNLSYTQDEQAFDRRLVIRVSPTGDFCTFPEYNIPQQFDIMKALADNTDVPVPPCLWKEYDKSILDEVFFVMEHVDGDIPADNPPYPCEGFVKDATPAQREAMWWNGIAELARLHNQDYKKAGLDFLAFPDPKQSPIAQHLAYYENFFHWAARGKPQPTAEAALEYLKAKMPTDEPTGIIWGDARVGNQIFRDFRVVALLDWEMAALGNPEADLAWWLFVDKTTMKGNGNPAFVRPRLEGLPTDAPTIARYEELTGRKVEHLKYYEIFAGFRFACVMIRVMQQVVHYGIMPEEVGLVLERNNAVTQTLAEIMELPPPE